MFDLEGLEGFVIAFRCIVLLLAAIALLLPQFLRLRIGCSASFLQRV